MGIFVLKNLGFDYLNHVSNSHDFARTDNHLFPIHKKVYKGKMFGFIRSCKQQRNRISMTKDHICFGRCEKNLRNDMSNALNCGVNIWNSMDIALVRIIYFLVESRSFQHYMLNIFILIFCIVIIICNCQYINASSI